MSLADRARARASRGRAGWRRYERVDVDIEMLEDAVKDYRWCAYTRDFEHISKFSNEQRTANCGERFCQNFSNKPLRASMKPSVEMTDAVLRKHLERANFIVVGINDTVPVPVPSERALRAAGRVDQDLEELVEDVAQQHAEARVDDADADVVEAEADSSGASAPRGKRSGKRKEALAKNRAGKKRAAMTAEQQQQSARDRAERESRLTKEALDQYVCNLMPNMTFYDESVHTTELQRDPGDRTLVTYDRFTGDASQWATALDDGPPDDERQKAAENDIAIIEGEQKAAAQIADPTERDVKLRLLVRIKNRLVKIAKGTAGFSDLSRGDWRLQGCGKLMVDGSKYTCIQDALLVVCRYIGAEVSKAQVYADFAEMVQPKQEAVVADVCCYAREKLKLNMVCISHGPEDALSRRKGGIGFATLQLDHGAFIIVLKATLADGGEERHALAFLADFKHPAYRNHLGALVDNDPRVDVRFLQPSDRATVADARKVFDGLFWTATRVMITSVWQVSKPPTLVE